MKLFQILIFTCLLFASRGSAQTGGDKIVMKDSAGGKWVTLAVGPQFKASPWKEFWWGAHWRKEWIAPVSFPVFDLDTTAGGLTPLKRGGGHETKSLRLQGKNGREYVLRTMDKSLDLLIPEEFKGTFINDVVNDQISTAHPYGPIVASHLAGSAGLMHTNPVIAFVPDNPRLGEYRNDFAYKLCLFEERSSGDGWEHTALTHDADEIVNSEKLFEKLKEDNDRRVDQKEYLKVRLFDMLINDWDRHEDQWVWAGFKHDGKTTYQPFARDRDQSFSKTDGVNLYFLSRPWALRSLQDMDANLKDVIGTNIAARFLDKQFMNELTETDWQNIIENFQSLLTDEAILKALQKMPAAAYNISGDFLYQRLRERRNNMPGYGMQYYKIINKAVTITGSDKPEIFRIHKTDDHTTEIVMQAVNKKGDPGDTLFHRVFTEDVTKEITLYGLDSDDEFIYEGKTSNGIFVRMLGGDGNDKYTDNSAHITNAVAYDAPGDAPAATQSLRYRATTDTIVTGYNRKWFNYDWSMPLIFPAYNPDDGVLLGAGITYKKQKWNKKPFGWQQTISGQYAFATGAYALFYNGVFKQAFGKWDLDLQANYKAPTYVINFYGFGNGTKLITKEKSFYRVRAASFLFNPEISRSWKQGMFSAGLMFNTIKVQTTENKFINLPIPGIDSSVYDTKYFAGADISYDLNTADNRKHPTKGIHFYAASSWLANLKDAENNFLNLTSSFTFYFSPVKGVTIAHRTGAATNLGEYEFYQANTLGGSENLRGYWRTRFTGRSAFFQNTDLRLNFGTLKGYVLRGDIGIYGFLDDGRVWVKEEDSNTLHTGYGGGLYFVPFNALAINLSYETSKEVNIFRFRAGFLF